MATTQEPKSKRARKRRGRKPGPKTNWFERSRYLKGRCIKRLKPNQIAALKKAHQFAALCGTPLNFFVTIKFGHSLCPQKLFGAGRDRLSKALKRVGLELRLIYVWENVHSLHVHCLVHSKPNSLDFLEEHLRRSFKGCDILVQKSHARSLTYMLKGTDWATYRREARGFAGYCKIQGVVPWKRSGFTEDLGEKAQRTHFEASQIGQKLHRHPKTVANAQEPHGDAVNNVPAPPSTIVDI